VAVETKITGRYLAQLVLDRIDQDQAYANLELHKVFRENSAVLERREKAFITELVYGTLRHRLKIDYILGRLLSRPLASLKVPVKNILRLAIYQLLYLPEIPERAVCHSAVEQIKSSQYTGLTPLVNGVLRSYLRQKNTLEFPDPVLEFAAYLSVEYSHPLWLVKRWLTAFGPDSTTRILKTNNESPALSLRVNRRLTTTDQVKTELADQGIESRSGMFVPEALYLGPLAESIETMALFKTGQIFVQDESAMLVAHLLNPVPGELIVDLCAAPGGKSTHLAELMDDCGEIISVDNYPHKINLILENTARLDLKSIKPILADARSFSLSAGKLADAVLVDAPCSGTGVLRRRVDARYRRRPEDLPQLVEIQRAILDRAATLVKPGGRLVYSTCALEPEENEKQIQSFLERHPEFEPMDFRPFLPEAVVNYASEYNYSNWLTILPAPNGGDGFFMCRLEKTRQVL